MKIVKMYRRPPLLENPLLRRPREELASCKKLSWSLATIDYYGWQACDSWQDLDKWILRGRGTERDMFIRDVRRSER